RRSSSSADELKVRAEEWAAELSRHGVRCSVDAGESAIGGGSLPGETLPTWCIAITPPSSEQSGGESQAGRLARLLRSAPTPIIARVDRGRVLIDPPTVQQGEEEVLLQEI